MSRSSQKSEKKGVSVEDKLKALYELQEVMSQIDRITKLRGELPIEVSDLEDELAGLQTRIEKLQEEVKDLETIISNKRGTIVESIELTAKYKEQQNNVRNNREYDSLSKEIEFQTLEVELAEKRIKEFIIDLEKKKKSITEADFKLNDRKIDLTNKKQELNDITAETSDEEQKLADKSIKIEQLIDERLVTAFKRIRSNARNGLAIVTVNRGACGGCFNRIPPQRHLDIASNKKVIVCEYCGRILVDKQISGEEE